jgi:hypothetical protein
LKVQGQSGLHRRILSKKKNEGEEGEGREGEGTNNILRNPVEL